MPRECKEEIDTSRETPLTLTLELREELSELTVTRTVPCEQLSAELQRAAWFIDGSSKLNG